MILTMVVVPEDPRHMTTNLAGPLVVNVKTRQGRQIILNSEKYPLRFPVLIQD
jgi:flagellar assembly factor FliW